MALAFTLAPFHRIFPLVASGLGLLFALVGIFMRGKTIAGLTLTVAGIIAGTALVTLSAWGLSQGWQGPWAESIEGAWEVRSIEMDGSVTDMPSPLPTQTFRSGRVVTRWKGPGEETTYQLDASKQPKEIDMNMVGGRYQGIYKIEGDILTICVAGRPWQARPKEFTGSLGSGQMQFVLKRKSR
jgi:uncharacterized protein (TIGR03067 family)